MKIVPKVVYDIYTRETHHWNEMEQKFLFSFKEMNKGNLVSVMPLVVAKQILPDLHPDPFFHAAPEIAVL